ncbi:MAG TPA: ABC transporter permease [Terriglobales bacterium]|jgi:ABC-2 type transport system permease protein|nr:ABC transporter permease [Terriglobales bacterium]
MLAIIRTAMASLRRDRGALSLSFILPVVFFSIFAVIFGGRRDTTPKIHVLLVDEDHSRASGRLAQGLKQEGSLVVKTRPDPVKDVQQPEYTATTAELAVKEGAAPVAVIIPHGFGENPISLGPADNNHPAIQLLEDSSDAIAPQVISGLLQKVAMTSMPDVMADQGSKYFDQFAGGLTREQRERLNEGIRNLRERQESGAATPNSSNQGGGIIAVKARAVVGANKNNPMVSFYAAAIGVMFLLFTASGAAGALLDEAESGTLDRVLSSRVTMTSLLLGKVTYNSLLAFAQLVVMFLWGWAAFKLDLWSHIPGFVVMGVCTAVAVASFGMLLASICRTRAQLSALSTLVILIMSSIGGSMFPRFLMPEAMQKAGLFTINAWAIDGFTKVFWRDEPISHLWPQVLVLVTIAIVLFVIARRVARRWEVA